MLASSSTEDATQALYGHDNNKNEKLIKLKYIQ